jgi:hemerythrin-like domain-containing protein
MGTMLQGPPYVGTTGVFNHPTMKFARMLDGMKEEHAELRKQLITIAECAAELDEGKVPVDGLEEKMGSLAEKVLAFLEQFARHAKEENDVLVPTVKLYADKGMTSLEEKAAIMERAAVQFRAFLDLTDDCLGAPCRDKAGKAAKSLLEACASLKRLIVDEANTLYPLAEEIIADIEYLSC